ncbi:MAG: carboxylesterase family protein [Noviherbaspirillum sp.]
MQFNKRYARPFAAAAIVIPMLAACGGSSNNNDPTGRVTLLGQVTGVNDTAVNGTLSWKGIPYAKPPVGALRWKAPVDPDAWTSARAAKSFAPACVQYGRIYGPGANNTWDATVGTTLNQAVGSEDCLYLNVWRPSNNTENLPVIVFYHGGSNVSGYTADPVYDGANLARTANAVVVTVNFRLGIFGFMNMPQLKTGDAANDSGNFAILDSIKALQFINKNIASFGGDPNNVTIMGQSAGAINVYALLSSPQMASASPRLFHKSAPLSGGLSLASNLPAGSIPTMSPASTYLLQGNALLKQMLIADGRATDATVDAYIASQTSAQLADFMRSRDSGLLLNVLLGKLAALGLSGSGPIPDGTVVPTDAIAAINAGNYVKGPVLASNTRDEGKLFPSFLPLVGGTGNARIVTDAQLVARQLNYNPDAAPQVTIEQWIAASYLPVNTPVSGFTARADELNRRFLLASNINILDTLKAKQPDVYYYQFNWDEEPAPWNDIYGAAHLFDLPFIFGNFGPSLMSNVMNSSANRGGRLDLSDAMMKSLGAFARTGNPNDASLGVTWPVWPRKLMFDATLTAKAISVQ